MGSNASAAFSSGYVSTMERTPASLAWRSVPAESLECRDTNAGFLRFRRPAGRRGLDGVKRGTEHDSVPREPSPSISWDMALPLEAMSPPLNAKADAIERTLGAAKNRA
jgi:hypothetical protein